MDEQEAKNEIAEICREIGCRGDMKGCPGDPDCAVIQRLFAGNKKVKNTLVQPLQPPLF